MLYNVLYNISSFCLGIVLHKGLAKGVKIIENNGKPVPALVADGIFFNASK